MFVLKMIRYILGYVEFKGFGGFNERFLNLCAARGINIWNVNCTSGELTAFVMAKNYKLLRECAKLSGLKLRVKKRRGFSFVLHRYRYRIGVPIGILGLILILTLSTNYIWVIKVEGNSQIDSETIISTMNEIGLSSGILKRDVDISDLEFKAIEKIDELSWMAIHIRGSVATIEVRERVFAPEFVDSQTPCNVVASTDGYITKIEAYDGFTAVDVGESVTKGDLLINGVVPTQMDTTRFLHAHGIVMAKTKRELIANASLVEENVIYTGKAIRKTQIKIFGVKIPLYFSDSVEFDNEMKETVNNLEILGIELPFGIDTKEYREVVRENITINKENALEKARESINQQKASLIGITIDCETEKVTIEGNKLILVVYMDCEEDIAVKEKILFEEK